MYLRLQQAKRAGTFTLPPPCTLTVFVSQVDAAQDLLQELMAEHPEDAQYPYELGTVFYEHDMFEAALAAYATVLRNRDDARETRQWKAKALVNIGVIRYKQGQLEESLDAFRRASSFDPSHKSAKANTQAIQHLLDEKAKGAANSES